jgi:protein-S-isoprenylcysteine O-methyltransferase Ste14
MNRMKAKSFLLGTTILLVVWVGIPLLLISLNKLLDLPIYNDFYLKIIGSVFLIVGLSIVSYSTILHLKTGRVTPLPVIEKPKQFMVDGLYKYCRNPMYLAIMLIFFGGFLILGHLLLLLYFLTSFPVLHIFVVYVEEPELKKLFGEQYLEYAKKVPRWFPKLKNRF